MRKRLRFAKVILIAIFCAVTVIIAWFVIIPHNVDQNLRGILWRDGDNTTYKPITVEIHGQRAGPCFWGNISIPEMDLSIQNTSLNLHNGYTWLHDSNRNDQGYGLSAMISTDHMQTIVLLFQEDCHTTSDGTIWCTTKGTHGLMLSAPCDSRKDAVCIANRQCTNSMGYKRHFPSGHLFN